MLNLASVAGATAQLHRVDWLIIVAYCVGALVVGIIFTRRAEKSIDEFFVAGRNLPWWLAGTSMVATTFASDTPLVVSGFVRRAGIFENWMWWKGADKRLLHLQTASSAG